MGKGNKVRSLGVALAWLAVMGACGSRNALPGGLAVDEDDAVSGTGGQSSGAGVNTARAAIATAVASTVGNTSAGMAVSAQVSGVTSAGFSVSTDSGFSVSTTGSGGGPTCDWAENTGGAAGAPNEPAQASCAINFCDGWAPREGNCASMQGAFFPYSDDVNGGSSTIALDPGSSVNNQACASGHVTRVIDGQYDVYWGAGFGMHLNQPEFNAYPEPYDAKYFGVTGFGFWVDGLTYDGELRFMVRGADDYYCASVPASGGYHEFSLADLVKGCWDPISTEHDYSRLLSLEWHFVSNADYEYDYNVCISGLTVYRQP